MSAYSPPTRRIPSCSSDYPQCEAEAHTLFPLPSHQIKTQNLSFLKRHRQIFLFPRLKEANSSPFCAKTDENFVRFCLSPSTRRAWIEIVYPQKHNSAPLSPSTRRAWIEIAYDCKRLLLLVVALHPEGVDRNTAGERRNGIAKVALHPEGVDRNYDWGVIAQHFEASRPPPKGRG